MNAKEQYKDWILHYQYILKNRSTLKNKKKMVQALVHDILQITKNIQVIEFQSNGKESSQNVYVGDLKHANVMICTYFDTPLSYWGPYYFFQIESQKKQTMIKNIFYALITLAIGVGLTLFYMKSISQGFSFFSWKTLVVSMLFGIYFVFLAKVSKGQLNRKNLIRNTSSILCLLQMIRDNKRKDVVFAFLDKGCQGDLGLEAMKDSLPKDCKIYYLDSIGAHAPLHVLGRDFSQEILDKYSIDWYTKENDVNVWISADKNSKGLMLTKKTIESEGN